MALHIIEQMEYAQKHFVETINSLNHDETISFEDKARLVDAYKTVYPLWPHNIVQLEEALDRINPAYAGRTPLKTCGLTFWVIKGEIEYFEDGHYSYARHDSYLNAATGITHTIETYAWDNEGEKYAAIYLDAERVYFRHWFSDAIRSTRLALFDALDASVNQLLIKLDALPF